MPGYIDFRRLKKKGRPWDRTPIQPALFLALRTHIMQQRLTKHVFPYSIQAADQMFCRVRTDASLRPHLTLHGYRHGFAYNYLAQSTDSPTIALAKLQRLLGHESIATTTQYVRPTFASLLRDSRQHPMKF